MATAKGVEVTKLDNVPRKLMEAQSGMGKVRVFMDTIAAATTDIDDDDIILMAELPSNSKILSILLFNDDLDSGGTPTLAFDIGVYNGKTAFKIAGTVTDADAVIDRDSYVLAAATLQAANTLGVEMAFEERNINLIANYLWEDCGLAEDPHVNLRIAMTLETVAQTAAAGDISWIILYSVE